MIAPILEESVLKLDEPHKALQGRALVIVTVAFIREYTQISAIKAAIWLPEACVVCACSSRFAGAQGGRPLSICLVGAART
jgi:hypothetical protein